MGLKLNWTVADYSHNLSQLLCHYCTTTSYKQVTTGDQRMCSWVVVVVVVVVYLFGFFLSGVLTKGLKHARVSILLYGTFLT